MSDDVILKMSQKLDKSKHGTDEQFTSKQDSNWKIMSHHEDSNDNPIVSLEPEDEP